MSNFMMTHEDSAICDALGTPETAGALRRHRVWGDSHDAAIMRSLLNTDAGPDRMTTLAGLGMSAHESHMAFVHPRGHDIGYGCSVCAAHMYAVNLRAWTGGPRPRKYLMCSPVNRALRSLLFRREAQAVIRAWGTLALQDARACYVSAKYDALATLRSI